MKTGWSIGLVIALTVTPFVFVHAESVRFVELEGFGSFLDGNPESTGITEDGALTLPPLVHERYAAPSTVFSAATWHQDAVVVAQVEDGQVLRIDARGRVKKLIDTSEGMITQLLSLGNASADIIMATSAKAKLYRLGPQGNVKVLYAFDANFVWDVVAGNNGTLYCVTGEPGTVVAVDPQGNGKILWRSEQKHLRVIAFDEQLGLFVGGGERGVVYRASDRNHFYALFDTGNEEITSLVVHNQQVFAAGVTNAGVLINDRERSRSNAKADVRSQIVRIDMNGGSELVAGSVDEVILSMVLTPNEQLMVATGTASRDEMRGRLYSIEPSKRLITLVHQSPSRRITHILRAGNQMAAIAALGGRVLDIDHKIARLGYFTSQPFDTGAASRFGQLAILGQLPAGTGVEAAARFGQTATPDPSWSPWTRDVDVAHAVEGALLGKQLTGRFVQLRLTLHSNGQQAPQVSRLRLAYQRQNLAPFIREVMTLPKGIALYPLPHEDTKTKTNLPVVLLEKIEQLRQEEANRNGLPRARQVREPGSLTVRWYAEDLNNDELIYSLFLRSHHDKDYSLVKENLEDPFFTLHSTQLSDGYYTFLVHASDMRSNPIGLERSDKRESRAILIDNTKPIIKPLRLSQQGQNATVTTTINDAIGPLSEIGCALDQEKMRPVVPEDGLLDGSQEKVKLRFDNLTPGHHTLTIRAVDSADNEEFVSLAFTVPPRM